MTKRENWLERTWNSFLRVSLWLASIGLMIASSGVDGAYLAKLMPVGWGWLGLVLNTVADVSSEIIMYWYGRLKQAGRKRIWPVLVVECLLVGYAWLFSWRQLAPIVAEIEPRHSELLAGIMAAFIPVAIVGAGYVQSLLAGRVAVAKTDSSSSKTSKETDKPADKPRQVTAKLSTDQLRAAVLDAMLSEDPPTQTELADRLGVKRSAVGYHVGKLRQAGKLNGHRSQPERQEVAA